MNYSYLQSTRSDFYRALTGYMARHERQNTVIGICETCDSSIISSEEIARIRGKTYHYDCYVNTHNCNLSEDDGCDCQRVMTNHCQHEHMIGMECQDCYLDVS